MIPVMIDGTPTLALVDTGAATSSVLDRPGLLTRTVAARGTGAFGAPKSEERSADVRMTLGDLDLGVLDVEVVPPEQPGARALIGQDVLGRWCCEFRLGQRRLTIDCPSLATGTPIVVGRRGHVTLDVEWPDGTRARGLFDTGASLSVVDSGFLEAHSQIFELGEMTGGIDADGSTAETPTIRMQGPTILDDRFPPSLAVTFDLGPIQTPDVRFDMILGWPVLQHGAFTIDPGHGLARHSA